MHRIPSLASIPIAHNIALPRSLPFRPTLPAPKIDSFEVKVKSKTLNIELFSKVNVAMRSHLQSDALDGKLKLRQTFSSNDLKKLASLPKKDIVKSYLEGAYVAERYCALVDHGSAAQNNAQRVMAEYKNHLKHNFLDRHYKEELGWIKKDYEAGTGGENVEKDAKLLERAKHFYREVHHLEHDEKALNNLIKNDQNPLTSFIALRRALFAYEANHKP